MPGSICWDTQAPSTQAGIRAAGDVAHLKEGAGNGIDGEDDDEDVDPAEGQKPGHGEHGHHDAPGAGAVDDGIGDGLRQAAFFQKAPQQLPAQEQGEHAGDGPGHALQIGAVAVQQSDAAGGSYQECGDAGENDDADARRAPCHHQDQCRKMPMRLRI